MIRRPMRVGSRARRVRPRDIEVRQEQHDEESGDAARKHWVQHYRSGVDNKSG